LNATAPAAPTSLIPDELLCGSAIRDFFFLPSLPDLPQAPPVNPPADPIAAPLAVPVASPVFVATPVALPVASPVAIAATPTSASVPVASNGTAVVDGGSNTGAIAGGVVGAIVGLALIIALLLWIIVFRKRNKKTKPHEEPMVPSHYSALSTGNSGDPLPADSSAKKPKARKSKVNADIDPSEIQIGELMGDFLKGAYRGSPVAIKLAATKSQEDLVKFQVQAASMRCANPETLNFSPS
jgi:hypothetical protein